MDYCFFVNPDLDSESANVFWVEPIDPRILNCNLLPADYQRPCLKLVLNAKLFKLKRTGDNRLHILLSDQNGSIQLIFDSGIDFDCTLNFSINLISSINFAQKGEALICLEYFLCHGHFQNLSIPYPLNKFANKKLLFAFDLWKLGLSHREIGRRIYGDVAILDGWDGVSDNIRTRTRRLVFKSRKLVTAGALTFLKAN